MAVGAGAHHRQPVQAGPRLAVRLRGADHPRRAGVRPTVVCSTRDRNILAIESEVRGAIGNGVDSFLVVQGDMLPEVEHWSNSYEIVEHLRALQELVPRPIRGRHEHPFAAAGCSGGGSRSAASSSPRAR